MWRRKSEKKKSGTSYGEWNRIDAILRGRKERMRKGAGGDGSNLIKRFLEEHRRIWALSIARPLFVVPTCGNP